MSLPSETSLTNKEKISASRKAFREKNKERLAAARKEFLASRPKYRNDYYKNWYRQNREKQLAKMSEYQKKNRDEATRRNLKYQKLNRQKATAATAKWRAMKLQATPSWADPVKIKAFYIEARRLTIETGIPHQVDHIIPLKSKLVCGLHVETNLQILTGPENIRKSNRTWPDMF